MTTTAFDDQFTDAPVELVRQQYSTADILRRNVADLEIALKQQTERAEAADEKLTTAREDMQSWIDSRNGWMERAGAAEAELRKLREQKPVRWYVRGNYFHDGDAAILFASMNAVHGAKIEQLYAAPVPAPQAPAVPDGDDFNGSTPHLIQCMEALVRLDADGVLVPHGIGRSASRLLSAAANRLRKQTAPIPEEWRKVMARLLDTFERCEAGFHPHVEIRLAVRDEARALLQAIEVTK